jgi:nitronate monooxygenase
MTLPDQLKGRLDLPAIAAPLFLVSCPALVIETCRQGVLGTFPSLNSRTTRGFEDWIVEIERGLAGEGAATPSANVSPYGVNLIVHKTNHRLQSDLDVVVKHRVPVVITSVGNPAAVVEAVHGYGGLVIHDVTTVEWARRALEANVDGLIPVCNGAGGHAGTMNPFAFVPQIREFYDGLIVLAGCISDGRGIRAAQMLGADLAYMGTRFVAAQESAASPEYKEMLIGSTPKDLIYTPAFSGIPANMLRPSIVAAGIDPENLQAKGKIDLGEEFSHETKAWRDIWTAGQGVGSIHDVPRVADLIERLKREYRGAGA